jgi:hypothetical protein
MAGFMRREREMGTWIAILAETRERLDFWDIARVHGVQPLAPEIPAYALLACDVGFAHHAPLPLAEVLSRELAAACIYFAVQTNADVHEVHAFRGGALLRRLVYARDGGGWLQNEGALQPWERAYFFDDAPTAPTAGDGRWPDMLYDELSSQDIARYETARRAGDSSAVMDLMHPSSMRPMRRVCSYLGVDPERPAGRWKKPAV